MNNLRPAAIRGTFAAPQPIAVSRKQMFIPVPAKRGGFTPRIAPASRLGFASGDMRPFQRPPGNSRSRGFYLIHPSLPHLEPLKTTTVPSLHISNV